MSGRRNIETYLVRKVEWTSSLAQYVRATSRTIAFNRELYSYNLNTRDGSKLLQRVWEPVQITLKHTQNKSRRTDEPVFKPEPQTRLLSLLQVTPESLLTNKMFE